MAGSLSTTNYDLSKYAPNDTTSWLVDFNGNMDKIDAQMKANENGIAGVSGKLSEMGQKVSSLQSRTTSLENDVATLQETTTYNEIITAASSNTASKASKFYKIGDLIMGTCYYAINKAGNNISTIEISSSSQKFMPIILTTGNPFNFQQKTSPIDADLAIIGTLIYKVMNKSEPDVIPSAVRAYYNGTNTIIGAILPNTILTSNYTLQDGNINMTQKILRN